MSERRHTLRGSAWVTGALVAAIVAIFALCLVLADTSSAAEGEAFGGTDSVVTTQLAESGVEPWFEPLFEPNSGEVESGLFAVQAALGAGILGYCLGNLNGRRTARASAELAGREPRDA